MLQGNFISFTLTKKQILSKGTTDSPSSKYEHRRTSALLHNIQNIRISMGKKLLLSVTYENERISIKNSLPYLKCVIRLSYVVHGPIYDHNRPIHGRKYGHKSARGPHRRDVTHILSKVRCFLLKSFHFGRLRKRQVFSPYKSLYFECYATMPMLANAHISSLPGLPVVTEPCCSSSNLFQISCFCQPLIQKT